MGADPAAPAGNRGFAGFLAGAGARDEDPPGARLRPTLNPLACAAPAKWPPNASGPSPLREVVFRRRAGDDSGNPELWVDEHGRATLSHE